MHSKTITDQEKEIIGMLDELGLLGCTAVSSVEGDTLIEYEGVHEDRTGWDIIKLWKEAMEPFHRVRTGRFMPGIYSFMNSGTPGADGAYTAYLRKELDRIISSEGGMDPLTAELSGTVSVKMSEMAEHGETAADFCLLHGDLHNGNILMLDGRYVLIDFEYMRFGPSLLEWAFVLFWDLVSEENADMRQKILRKIRSELSELEGRGILSSEDIRLILELYLPVLLCAASHYAIAGKYADSAAVYSGIDRFWHAEYGQLRKESGHIG